MPPPLRALRTTQADQDKPIPNWTAPEDVKREWRTRIDSWLHDNGYTLNEEDLPANKRVRWRQFFERTDPWTGKKWNKLTRNLTKFLEAEMVLPVRSIQRPLRPSAFLKLPADVLAQIVPHLYPVDVINLTHVNKSTRNVLMNRSASPMWRACIKNAGMPACPSNLSEPKYLSVLFSHICSSCGVEIWTSPNTCLLVRLCGGCISELLVNWNKIEPEEIKPLVLSVRDLTASYAPKSLKQEVEITAARFHELRSQNNEQLLNAWIQAQKDDIQSRLKHDRLLSKSVEATRQQRDNELKQMWRKRAEERVREMGHTPPKENDLPVDKRRKWKGFMERGISWSESEWNRQKQQVIQFITNDEKERPERERKLRQSARDTKLHELFDSLWHTMNILPDNSAELSVAETANIMAGWLPLPRYADALEWPIIQNLLKTDVSTGEMVVQFEGSRDEIMTHIADFGLGAKKEWAKIAREGRSLAELAAIPPRPCLVGCGSEANPFEKLDQETCLLFRADTFLDFNNHRRNQTQSYDSLVGLARPGEPIHITEHQPKFNASEYKWNREASSMAQTLLRAMGHPVDTSLVELSAANGQWFACGRCTGPRMSWPNLVSHYCRELNVWKKAQPDVSKLQDGVSYHNIHASDFGTKPLVKCLSAAEAEELETRYPGGEDGIWDEDSADDNKYYEDSYRFGCRLCMDAELGSPMSFYREDIHPHLNDVHDVSDVQNDLDVEEDPYVCVLEVMPGWGWCSVG